MNARFATALVAAAMMVGGGAVMKTISSVRAATRDHVSFVEASFGTSWMRGANGRIRWFVPAWVVFWSVVYLVAAFVLPP